MSFEEIAIIIRVALAFIGLSGMIGIAFAYGQGRGYNRGLEDGINGDYEVDQI